MWGGVFMTFQELFLKGCTFEQFVNKDMDINRDRTLELYHQIELSEELIASIESIDIPIKILAFAEIWCPDCMINVPALQKIQDINHKLEIKLLPREGNEESLIAYKVGGKAKIPTFIVMDENFNELGVFIETPKVIKDIVARGNQVEVIVAKRKYRKGENVIDTIKEILEFIMKK